MEPHKLLVLAPGKGPIDMVLRDEMGKLWARLEKSRGPDTLKGSVVGVTAPAPGDGSTTVSVALARFLAYTLGANTCLVEANFRRPVLGRIHPRFERGPGLFEALSGGHDLEQAVQPVNGRDLSLLPAGAGAHGAFFPDEEALATTMEKLRQRHEALVLDCPPLGLGAEPRLYLGQADVVVLVVQAGRTKLESLERCLGQVEEIGTPLGAVVLNQVVTSLPRFLSGLF